MATTKYTHGVKHTIAARSGVAVPLMTGSTIKVINTHGTQVIDTWAIIPHATSSPTAANPFVYMSMCHTRASTLHLTPLPGDSLVTNQRKPILKLLEDSSAPACVHDTLIAACDIHRYHELGVAESDYHDSCSDNFRAALERDVGITGFQPSPPDPFNLWMNIPVKLREDIVVNGASTSNGAAVSFEAPVSGKGDYVVLQALRDCVIVMSACPQDILKINDQNPKDAHFIVDEVK